jgi:hypothetical protein
MSQKHIFILFFFCIGAVQMQAQIQTLSGVFTNGGAWESHTIIFYPNNKTMSILRNCGDAKPPRGISNCVSKTGKGVYCIQGDSVYLGSKKPKSRANGALIRLSDGTINLKEIMLNDRVYTAGGQKMPSIIIKNIPKKRRKR